MTYAAAANITAYKCSNCSEALEPEAKFCGHCGFIVASGNFNVDYLDFVRAKGEAASAPARAPSFATSGIPVESETTRRMISEANKLMILLARERIFLFLHWAVFIGINLFGCWMAWKCYADFLGDEMTKIMMASTPFLYINSMALLCLVPIKGTRNQIALLKERIQYLRFNIEFGHLQL